MRGFRSKKMLMYFLLLLFIESSWRKIKIKFYWPETKRSEKDAENSSGIARVTSARDRWRMRLICITSRVAQIVQLLKIFPCHGV